MNFAAPASEPDFRHVETWVFDLDNTLYPAHCDLFAQIDRNMRGFVSRLLGVSEDEAHRIQKEYYRDYGTTLAGLMAVNKIDPADFLRSAHDIDLAPISPDRALAAALERLPGRKLVFTNGTVAHARRVLEKIGADAHFDDIFDIVHADYLPKPNDATFARFVAKHGVEPARAAMFEDLARNLAPAKRLGMTTVLVVPQGGHADPAVRSWGEQELHAGSVDWRTDDLAAFLASLAVRETTP